MKRLFSKILLAQVLTVLSALLVVTLITRISLEQGLKRFLEAQEQTVLQSAATMLGGSSKLTFSSNASSN